MYILPIDIFTGICYYIIVRRAKLERQEGGEQVAGKKKGGNQDRKLQTLILVTAILNLIKSLIDLVRNLTG